MQHALNTIFFFFLKNRHHNKVLICEVHGEGANEHRYMNICYNICPGIRAMQKYMAANGSLGGATVKPMLKGHGIPRARGGPEPGMPRPKITPARGWRGWAGHVRGVSTRRRPKLGFLAAAKNNFPR